MNEVLMSAVADFTEEFQTYLFPYLAKEFRFDFHGCNNPVTYCGYFHSRYGDKIGSIADSVADGALTLTQGVERITHEYMDALCQHNADEDMYEDAYYMYVTFLDITYEHNIDLYERMKSYSDYINWDMRWRWEGLACTLQY